jgi:cbb3-type cytochrome oxidase cytochrome c subunit
LVYKGAVAVPDVVVVVVVVVVIGVGVAVVVVVSVVVVLSLLRTSFSQLTIKPVDNKNSAAPASLLGRNLFIGVCLNC